MKIQHLGLKGFIGIRDLDIDTENFTLICGYNETGKTSIQQAISLALRGMPIRVSLKKNYGELVNDGHDNAEVVVKTDVSDTVVSIRRKDGKTQGLPNPDNLSSFMHACLDMTHFTSLADKERRKLVFSLSGNKQSVDEVMTLLEESGANMDKAATIKNQLIAGFDAAMNTAKDKATECRALWKRTTGETYGSDKAEKWSRELREIETASEKLKTSLNSLQRKRNNLDSKVSHQQGVIESRDKIQQSIEDIKIDANPEELEKEKQTTLDLIAKQSEELKGLQSKLAAQQEGAEPDNLMTCPDCAAPLVIEGGKLVGYQPVERDEKVVEQLITDIKRIQGTIHTDTGTLREVEAKQNALNRKAHLREQLNSMVVEGEEIDIEAARKDIASLDVEIEQVSESLKKAIEDENFNSNAEKDNKAAMEHHNSIKEWLHIRDQLSPEGIPSAMMSRSLEPLNVHLQQQAVLSGWPEVQIATDMSIYYGNRPYDLCSESAQWRTQAMITAAISFISNIGFIVLDRADVLDMGGRTQMVDWIYGLNDKDLQVIVCATLKQEPELGGAKVVWLGGGN